jgi:uncharacterized protein
MTFRQFHDLKYHVMGMLRQGLPQDIYYHTPAHTLDVMISSESIAVNEGITDEKALTTLRLATLFHDTGYLISSSEHERFSCDIARKELANLVIDPATIDEICELIMATMIPQQANSRLAMIICDADLDYLGRKDYYEIAEKLKDEFRQRGLITSDAQWIRMQISFMQSHTYFTETSKRLREPEKQNRIVELQQQLAAMEASL